MAFQAYLPIIAMIWRKSMVISREQLVRYDADGNPVTHYEMFDVFWFGLSLAPWLALLITNPF